ncbi:hypothetical protein FB45DRAFT_1049949 [Roridomyces roridus]|uniref:Uncharacterized protein n=1 Tax=Roridomyces roridus TaxID=1738132 RepID=A0AAD7CIG5_9AGAR|nr:hypothetical protein FB45DRAFT_1049949 [Roridomyces roridus]
MLSPWLITPRCPSVSSSASNPNLVEKNAGKHEHHLQFPTLAPCAITKSKRTVDGASYEQQHPRPQTLTFTPTPLSPSPRFLPSIIVNLNSPLRAHTSPATFPQSPPPRAVLIVPAATRTRTTCGTGVPPGSSRPSPSSNSTSPRRSFPPSSCVSLPPITTSPKVTHTKPKPKRTPPQTLHRRAVLASLRATPHGAKIVHMGARLAVGILGATAQLERLCTGEQMHDGMSMWRRRRRATRTPARSQEAEPDVAMPDVELEMLPVLSASWVVLGESQPESRMQSRSEAEQEWEMVE